MEAITYKRHPEFRALFCGTSGDIFSLNKSIFLKGTPDKDGYLSICVSRLGKAFSKRKHRLIMEAFVGISDLTVDHLNNVKTDNRLTNLEYVTREENVSRSYHLGASNKRVCNGERANGAKLRENEVKDIIKMGRLKKYKIMELVDLYRVSYATIFNITRNKSWRYLQRPNANP